MNANDNIKILESIIKKMNEEDKDKKDVIVPLNKLEMNNLKVRVNPRAEGVNISTKAISQIIGMSNSKDQVSAQEIVQLMKNDPNKARNVFNAVTKNSTNKDVMVRLGMDKKHGRYIRAIFSDKYTPVGNATTVKILEKVIDRDRRQPVIDRVHYTPDDISIRIVMGKEKMNASSKVGDVLYSGMDIRNSEIGNSSLIIVPVIFRLVCTNGMISGRGTEDMSIYQKHVGIKDIESIINRGITNALTINEGMTELLIKSKQIVVDPLEELTKVLSDPRLAASRKDAEAIADVVFGIGGDRKYDVVNTLTQYGRDQNSFAKRTKFEEMAGIYLRAA